MKIIKIVFIVLLASFLLLVLGILLPSILINNGVKQFSGEKKLFANYAYREGESFTREYPGVTAVKIIKINQINSNTARCIIPGDKKIQFQYQAEAKVYGLWGTSYGKLIIPCQGDLRFIH